MKGRPQELAKEISTVAGSVLVLTVTFSRDLLEGTGEKVWLLAVTAWTMLLMTVILGLLGFLNLRGYALAPAFKSLLLNLQIVSLGIGLVLILACGILASRIFAHEYETGEGGPQTPVRVEPVTIKVEPSTAGPPAEAKGEFGALIALSAGFLGLGAGIALLVSSSTARRTAILLTA